MRDDAERLRVLAASVPADRVADLTSHSESVGIALAELLGTDDTVGLLREALAAAEASATTLVHVRALLEQAADHHTGAAAAAAAAGSSTPQTERLHQARQRVGSRAAPGTAAVGEWVRSDGWSVRITSGTSDDHHNKTAQYLRSRSDLSPAVVQLARHVEVKIAVAMREQGGRDETVVIDREVCGTRPFDRAQPYTCDKYLARLLPAGARLRVVQPDGTVRVYTGEESSS
ncbi:DddA-like double-stranded DNA deaminase toxin [Prauserella halophila]|nr:DddA-like double-stranded DNA deaminase toxin [Prauserella halophila]